MKKLKISIFMILVMILAVSAVSAADVDGSSDLAIEDVNNIAEEVQTSTDADVVVNYEEDDEPGNFTGLKETIESASGTLPLEKDYTYDKDDLEDGITINKDIVIDGLKADGNRTKIDADNQAKIFKISQGTNVVLKNIKFLSATGAIVNEGNLTIENCLFMFNDAENGGAIYSTGTLTVKNSDFSINYADKRGGAIYSTGDLTITDTLFYQNEISDADKDNGGAAIFSGKDSTLKIYNSNITENVAPNDNDELSAGAVYIYNATHVLISDCLFNENDAAYGGAFTSEESTQTDVIIKNSIFANNTAFQGGAINVNSGVKYFNITGSHFIKNQAVKTDKGLGNVNDAGGAIHVGTWKTTELLFVISDSTFDENSVESNAGGALMIGKYVSAIIDNCNFTKNTAIQSGVIGTGGGNTIINISNSRFVQNGPSWAAIIVDENTLNVKNCYFEGNTGQYASIKNIWKANNNGVLNVNDSEFVITDSTVFADEITYKEDAIINGTFVPGASDLIPNSLNLLLNGNKVASNTLALSSFNFTVSGLSAGNYNISFSDDKGNKFYLANGILNQITVKPKENTLNITIDDVEYPNVAKAIVCADVDGTYAISINNIYNFTVTVSGGKGETDLTSLDANDVYNAVLIFNDKNYANLQNITTFKVNKATPIINIIVINATNATHATVKVTSTAAGDINITVNDKYYPIKNAEANKEYSIEIDVLPVAKVYPVEAKYVESTNYKETTASSNLKVSVDAQPSDITIPELTPGKEGTVTIPLPENATGNITVSVDGEVKSITSANGTTTVNIPAVGAGNHNIEIAYTGDDKYGAFTVTKAVNVKSLAKLTGSDVKAYYYDGSVYKIRLLGDDGNPLANVAVTIKVNGKKVATPKTDKNGYATYKIIQTPSTKAYTITAEAKGLKATNKVTVKQIINAKKTTKVKRSAKSLKIKITLKGKKVYKKQKVIVKFKGKKYNVKTNNKGVGYFKVAKKVIKKLKKGKTYSYTITYKKDVLKRFVKVTK